MSNEATPTNFTQAPSPLPLEALGSPPAAAGSGTAEDPGRAPEPLPLELLTEDFPARTTRDSTPTPHDGPSAAGAAAPSPMPIEFLGAQG